MRIVHTRSETDVREQVRELIYSSCLRLDNQDFESWLALCAPEFRYTITAYSPEIRKEMTWLDHDLAGMESMFNMLPKHNSDHSPLTRHASVYLVDYDESTGEASAVTSLTVYKTQLDGGATELFAVGKYLDKVSLVEGSALLASRNVRLDTRELGIGSHIPL